MKTVLITGCSSGFGLETARLFLEREWQVIATMRTPRVDLLPASKHLRQLALDVTDPHSIRSAVEAAGPIDVLVNNAGIASLNALEGTPMDVARTLFETNTLGPIALTQAVVPQFRQRRAGVIINVSSSVTLKALPLLAVYSGSKAALNAFTESLALELQLFNVRVNLILPGRAPETRLGDNARALLPAEFPEDYLGLAQGIFTAWQDADAKITRSRDVAEAVWRAANDPTAPLRIAAGADAVALAEML
jgi:NAD(P)-dependent dehydrogenase (short-subunit alcohol dehydrogenase family)